MPWARCCGPWPGAGRQADVDHRGSSSQTQVWFHGCGRRLFGVSLASPVTARPSVLDVPRCRATASASGLARPPIWHQGRPCRACRAKAFPSTRMRCCGPGRLLLISPCRSTSDLVWSARRPSQLLTRCWTGLVDAGVAGCPLVAAAALVRRGPCSSLTSARWRRHWRTTPRMTIVRGRLCAVRTSRPRVCSTCRSPASFAGRLARRERAPRRTGPGGSAGPACQAGTACAAAVPML